MFVDVGNDIKKLYKVDYFLNGKIIEFNGDFWHANPMFYKPNDIIKTFDGAESFAKDIWERDAKRKEAIEKQGFEVLVVWENDYASDPEHVVEQCVKFLNGKMETKNA